MQRDDDVVLVISNAPDQQLAKRMSHLLIEEGLAACVNIGAPMTSVYRWKGQVSEDDEIPLMIKTTWGRHEAAIKRLVELHPYEVPEAIVVPVLDGHLPYLNWVRE